MAQHLQNQVHFASQESFIEKIPAELLPKVITQLDHSSLRSLLDAFPSLCRYFLVVLEDNPHGETVPAFFTSPSLRSVLRSQYLINRPVSLLKLYETELCEIEGADDDFFASKLPKLDRNSFVHCFARANHYECTRPMDMEFMREIWTQRISRDCTHLEFDIQRSPVCVNYPILLSCFRNTALFQGLQSLRIEYCNSIRNVDFGHLKTLTVIFHDRPLEGRPRFCGIVAKNMVHFTIHYSDLPPIIKNIDFGASNRWIPGTIRSEELVNNSLSICHLPSLDVNLDSPLPIYPCRVKDLDFSPLASTKNFSTVRVIGGHDRLISKLNLSRTQSLIWKQTSYQSHPFSFKELQPTRRAMEDQLGLLLSFHTLLPNSDFPFSSAQVAHARRLHVIARNGICVRPGEIDIHWKDSLLVHVKGGGTEDDSVMLKMYRDGRDWPPNVNRLNQRYMIKYFSVYGQQSLLAGFDWNELFNRKYYDDDFEEY